MISFAPVLAIHSGNHLAKRKEAVAVTAPMLNDPSGRMAAAGEQWKFVALWLGSSNGIFALSSSARI